jgi:NodT family efflux transporter outer membrane factor (OMF) lipoprotein
MSPTARAPLALAALAAACQVGPVHEPPQPQAPTAWSAASGELAADAAWWRGFGDPVLDGLIERASAANIDLAIARARVLEARALRDAAAGGKWPSVSASAGAARVGPSENAVVFAPGDYDLYEAGFDARWEIDLFGRLDRLVEAAARDAEAAEEAERDARVTLVAEVAREYVTLRGAQRELAILRENLALQRDTLELTAAREQAGLSPELDTSRARTQAETTAAAIPVFEARARASILRLNVLVGEAPGALEAELGAGLPLEVLRRRPDVRRAERELARETELVGQRTAELYPRLVLFGSAGFQSQQLSDLFESGSTAWSLGGSLLAPIFEGGRLRAELRAQEARAEEAALAWRGTVLEALREVEDALSSLAREREREARLAAATQAARRSVELASDLNAQGLVDFFQVLDAQRELVQVESELAISQTQVAARAVALYKALGGDPLRALAG